ncbi:hypothetical protein Y032_0189g1202 [Ancylostoma ceylanicum]|uniref:Uncharacterized protein n=1 Tax=Ancylostoma ceylanicum TaxID=53326 RepID=A0A016SR44_9BILA|nr:hypothetical protein Y032_0189g1202 [Ancylostoma ceylanicum]
MRYAATLQAVQRQPLLRHSTDWNRPDSAHLYHWQLKAPILAAAKSGAIGLLLGSDMAVMTLRGSTTHLQTSGEIAVSMGRRNEGFSWKSEV